MSWRLYSAKSPFRNCPDTSAVSSPRTYLDHAATTPLRPEARAAMEEGFALWANPSSPHAEGRRAKAALEDARARVKAALDWDGEVIFTSGASEAAALAVSASCKPLTAMGAMEHDALRRFAGGDVAQWSVKGDTASLDDPPDGALGGLVAVQHVNSEIGTICDAAPIREAVYAQGGWWLADCAQSAGKLPLPPADMAILAAHKCGGPIGIGALLLRDFAMLKPVGGHERGYRRGTENLPAVMGMAAALEADREWYERAVSLRRTLDAGVLAAGGQIVAESTPRIATIGAYRKPARPATAQLIRLDAAGIAVSAGSACSSGTLKPSHVLSAMNYPHPEEVVRVSLGWTSEAKDVDRFLTAWSAL